MKFIIEPRRTGKTYRIIQEIKDNPNAIIVIFSENERQRLISQYGKEMVDPQHQIKTYDTVMLWRKNKMTREELIRIILGTGGNVAYFQAEWIVDRTIIGLLPEMIEAMEKVTGVDAVEKIMDFNASVGEAFSDGDMAGRKWAQEIILPVLTKIYEATSD